MARQPADTARIMLRKTAARARQTVNPGLLPGVDARLAAARRFHDLVSTIIADQGGIDLIAQVRLSLIQRFSAACVLAEQLEARMANGETVDIAEHAALTSSLVRVASRIGLARRAKDLTPTLEQYLASKAAEDEG
jgi:hypothetical protein